MARNCHGRGAYPKISSVLSLMDSTLTCVLTFAQRDGTCLALSPGETSGEAERRSEDGTRPRDSDPESASVEGIGEGDSRGVREFVEGEGLGVALLGIFRRRGVACRF